MLLPLNPPSPIPSDSPAVSDTLLAEALGSYLDEVAQYRSLCTKHEVTTGLCEEGEALHVLRLFPASDVIARHLCQAAARLPSWNESTAWKGNKQEWQELERSMRSRRAGCEQQSPLVTRGIAWDDLPLLLFADTRKRDSVLKIDLLIPPLREDLPLLPLRTIAQTLLCHAYLVPEVISPPLPLSKLHGDRASAISEYLKRTMPHLLYASQ